MHLLLTALSFDPDARAGMAIRSLAPAMNDPWCLLLRASAVSEPASGGMVEWARKIHDATPTLAINSNSSGEWVRNQRWKWATSHIAGTNQLDPEQQATDQLYNRLDFLSLESLLRLNGGL